MVAAVSGVLMRLPLDAAASGGGLRHLIQAMTCIIYKRWLGQVNTCRSAMVGSVSEAAFHALAEPHRRGILRLLREQPRSLKEIARPFENTHQALSPNLKVLLGSDPGARRPGGTRGAYTGGH